MEMGHHLLLEQALKGNCVCVCIHVCVCAHMHVFVHGSLQVHNAKVNAPTGRLKGGPRLEWGGCRSDGGVLSPLSLVAFLSSLSGSELGTAALSTRCFFLRNLQSLSIDKGPSRGAGISHQITDVEDWEESSSSQALAGFLGEEVSSCRFPGPGPACSGLLSSSPFFPSSPRRPHGDDPPLPATPAPWP